MVQVIAARGLGAEGYGVYGFVLSVSALFSVFADPNLQVLVAREVARDPGSAGRWLSRSFGLWATLSAFMVVLVAGYAALSDGRSWVVAAAALCGLVTVLYAGQTLVEAAYQGLRSMRPLLASNLISRGAYVLLAALAVGAGAGLAGLLAGQAVAVAIALVWLVIGFRGPLRAAGLPSAHDVLALGPQTVPFALNRLFGTVYLAGDVILLQLFVADEALGLYRAAGLFLVQVGALSVMLNRLFLPWFTVGHAEGRALGPDVNFAWRVAMTLAAPVAVGGALLAAPLLDLVGGSEYQRAAGLMAILMAALPLRFANNLLANVLSAIDRQGARTQATAVGAVGVVGLSLALVPWAGAVGAAWAVVAVEILVFAWQGAALRRVLPWGGLATSALRVAAACAGMGAVVVGLAQLPVLVTVAGGAGVYAGLAWLTGAWSRADATRLLRL